MRRSGETMHGLEGPSVTSVTLVTFSLFLRDYDVLLRSIRPPLSTTLTIPNAYVTNLLLVGITMDPPPSPILFPDAQNITIINSKFMEVNGFKHDLLF